MTPDVSVGPFSLFIGLRWLLWAFAGLFVGFCGHYPGQLWVWWVRNKLYILKKTYLWPKRRI